MVLTGLTGGARSNILLIGSNIVLIGSNILALGGTTSTVAVITKIAYY